MLSNEGGHNTTASAADVRLGEARRTACLLKHSGRDLPIARPRIASLHGDALYTQPMKHVLFATAIHCFARALAGAASGDNP